MLNIEEPQATQGTALFNLGFRPFFLGAAVFAVLAMLVWTAIYTLNQNLTLYDISPFAWHGHEMIYGYSMAIIAGFLLTAVRNWTNIETLNGTPLLLLFLLWSAARILPFLGDSIRLEVVALVDNLFLVMLILAVALPIIRAKLWVNLAIVSKLLLMLASNIVFYLGALGYLTDGIHLGMYSGLYLVIALILTMGRRVIPFFIERGVGYRVTLTNRKWLDIGSLVLFLLFWIAELTTPNSATVAILAAALLVLHSLRLVGWHTRGIWRKPLLWVLYLSYALITAGFALKIAAVVAGVSPFLALHAFAVGGVGMMTLGMMARVSLGHTGRDVQQPPNVLFWIFSLLLAAAVVRVLPPLLDMSHYMIWILLSQILWIIAFSVFAIIYWPILTQPRVDGRPG